MDEFKITCQPDIGASVLTNNLLKDSIKPVHFKKDFQGLWLCDRLIILDNN
ncbi:MAG: hypothetical protein IT235_09375 [Bacteroidia bacterium]|nr:hypothetical protein [Bacteroidia bacterium]